MSIEKIKNIELIDHDVFFEYESLKDQHKKHINYIRQLCLLYILTDLESKSCNRVELISFLIKHKNEIRFELRKAEIDFESADICIRWYASRLFDLEFKLNAAENKLYDYKSNISNCCNIQQ